jgi:hypothetical protein
MLSETPTNKTTKPNNKTTTKTIRLLQGTCLLCGQQQRFASTSLTRPTICYLPLVRGVSPLCRPSCLHFTHGALVFFVVEFLCAFVFLLPLVQNSKIRHYVVDFYIVLLFMLGVFEPFMF